MKVHLVIILMCISTALFGQAGNEWIVQGQQYYKIPVAKEGIYRLTYANLVAAGFPAAADPRTIKLFHRGSECAIVVAGESDGQFNSSDYVEFYGVRNDGTLDASLYGDPTHQPHKFYNLYSDTTAFFLTFGASSGKRMPLVQLSNTGLTAEPFHVDERMLLLHEQYAVGIDYGDIQSTIFDEGEGWMGNMIFQGQTGTYQIEGVVQGAAGSGVPSLEILLTGRGPMNHQAEVYAGSRLLGTAAFAGYRSTKQTYPLQWSDVSGDGKINVSVKVTGSPDRFSVNYISVRYPQQVNMASQVEKSLLLATNPSGVSLVQIANAPAGTRLYDVTDAVNPRLLHSSGTGTIDAIVNGTATQKKIWASSVFIQPAIRKVTFRPINPAAHDYLIITHSSLRKPAGGYTDPVKAYGEYRSLPQGGGYDTLIVDIDQLYDQFNYGERSARAIYQFMKFMASSKLPQYLFLIGKGLVPYFNYFRTPGSFPVYKDLVPTAGFPASDMAFTAGLGTTGPHNGVATGRLSAVGPMDVAAYLNKIKEAEAQPFNDLRRKNILHLSGGIYPGEPQLFRQYLEQFASVAEGFQLGGKVSAIAKQSTDIELINVADEVNKGVGLITFFGHSSPASSDFDIGFVTDPVMGYNNKGRYPVILMNGCSAGSFFLTSTIFGENWVNSSNKGAVGVIAHSGFAFSAPLRTYSKLFYDVAFGDAEFIGKGLGDVQKEVARRFIQVSGNFPEMVSQIQQMVLLGDPAYRVFGASRPDYEINPAFVSISSFNGEPVTALADSFKLSFVIRNFGRAIHDPIRVVVERTLNNGSVVTYDSLLNPVLYSDTIAFILPGRIAQGFGNNTFTIRVDADNEVEELVEENNSVSLQYFIPLNGTRNLFPDNFAIVNTRDVTLAFQHTDMLSEERDFILEVDTTDTFDSGFKKQFLVKGKVLARQSITMLDTDTLAYYWRTRLGSVLPNESGEWDLSSFTYIRDGERGWAQVHFPQTGLNQLQGLVRDPMLRELRFEETVTDVAVKTFSAQSGKPQDSVSLKINNLEYNIYVDGTAGSGCRNNTINLVAFDKSTTQPYPGIFFTWFELNNLYGSRRLICGREPYVINSYQHDELIMGNAGDIIRYVDNIPAGDSVLLFSMGDARYQSWPLAAKQKMGELGISVSQINNLSDGEPVVIFAKKGASPGSARFIRDGGATPAAKKIVEKATVTGRVSAGSMKSVLIGPSAGWQKFVAAYQATDASDQIRFNIAGVKANGQEDMLANSIASYRDLSDIDAKVYPYLRVHLTTEDPVLLTSGQLDKWLVIFQPVAEGLLVYNGPSAKQSRFEGQTLQADFGFINIGVDSFTDSLQVDYELVNPLTFDFENRSMRISAPLPGDTTLFVVPFNTIGHDGGHNLEVFVNPYVQAELVYDNNQVKLLDHLYVITDNEPPVLDVLVDGRHLQNDDFVVPSPQVSILLWDNNPYLLKKDTTGVIILLTYPCGQEACTPRRVYFSDTDVTWMPESETSEFRVVLTPEQLPEGKYLLRVEATDAHGNSSGAEPYEISFRVAYESRVELLPPYPNPFNYKVNFDFIVSGDELPSFMELRVIDVNGRTMFEAAPASMSAFHVGTNTVWWDGNQDNGASFPGGVYIYELTVVLEGRVSKTQGRIVLVR